MAGPIIRTYKGGSIIYMEKDRADDIYVLQSGRVVLTYRSPDGKNEIREDVKIGEFFGVKSALGRFPREETAQVIGGANVLVFKMSDFEVFVAQKTHLILKMMKVFSSQLRQIHSKVREQLGQFGEARSPSFELMNVAEVYHKLRNYEHAVYAYSKYLEHYPEGNYVSRAKELLNLAKRNSMFPTNMPELVYEPEKRILAQNPSSVPTTSINVNKQLAEMYQKAETFFQSNTYQEAKIIYKNLSELKELKSPEEEKLVADATYKYGICLNMQQEWDTAYEVFSAYVKKYPKGEKIKDSLFQLAFISQSKGEGEKAIMLYKKVLSMPPEDDEFSKKATQKIAELKG